MAGRENQPNGPDPLHGDGMRHWAAELRASGWKRKSLVRLEQVQAILTNLKEYWPLTLRQLYYQLVAAEIIANTENEYKGLSRLLTKARDQGLVPWEAIEDRSRTIYESAGWATKEEFIANESEGFLDGYRRDLMQAQDEALFVCVEKDALVRICHEIAFPYCVPAIALRGFSSFTQKDILRRRLDSVLSSGKSARIFFFCDLDPSGWWIFPDALHTFQEEFGLGDRVIGERVALTPEQVKQHNLPHDPSALKWEDTRAKRYVEQFGELAVEIDALPPPVLQGLVRTAIESKCDLSQFRAQETVEGEELQSLAELKAEVEEFMDEQDH